MALERSVTEEESGQGKTRIVIVNDHELLRYALRDLLNNESDLEVCGEAADVVEALRVAKETEPDLVISDAVLQASDGLELVRRLKARRPALPVLIFSIFPPRLFAERALRAGASGYVCLQQSSKSVLGAVRTVLVGEIYLDEETTQRLLRRAVDPKDSGERSPVETLTNRELEVFRLIGCGMTTEQIAQKLHLSPSTIAHYRRSVRAKLNVKTAAELAQQAVRWVLENG